MEENGARKLYFTVLSFVFFVEEESFPRVIKTCTAFGETPATSGRNFDPSDIERPVISDKFRISPGQLLTFARGWGKVQPDNARLAPNE